MEDDDVAEDEVEDNDDDDDDDDDVESDDAEEEEEDVDPRTATPVLHELTQSKCTWTCHKSNSMLKFTGKTAAGQDRDTCFARACAVEMHMDMSQELFFLVKITGKMPQAKPATHTLCEPPQSNAHGHVTRVIFRRNFQGKYRAPGQASALSPTVRTPQCGHAVWGKMQVVLR